MFNSLYHRISEACCYITVFLGDERISEGTGFAGNELGAVFTAAHVVTGRMPIRTTDYRDPAQRIYCKFPGVPVVEYGVSFCAITLEVEAFTAPIQIDLAVLLPKTSIGSKLRPLPVETSPPKLGERVFLAGYSDELSLPFEVDKLLGREFAGATEFLEAMNNGYMADMTGPLIKQGHIGNSRRVVAENTSQGHRVECEVMYIDNAMHSGASGGPILNDRGQVVGIITRRAVTSASQSGDTKLAVPSGCTIGIGLQALEHVAKVMASRQ